MLVGGLNALTRFISKTQGMPAVEILRKVGIVTVTCLVIGGGGIVYRREMEGISINSKREMEAIAINSKREMETIAINSKREMDNIQIDTEYKLLDVKQKHLDIIYNDKIRNIELDKKRRWKIF
jgi:hypothetical protein